MSAVTVLVWLRQLGWDSKIPWMWDWCSASHVNNTKCTDENIIRIFFFNFSTFSENKQSHFMGFWHAGLAAWMAWDRLQQWSLLLNSATCAGHGAWNRDLLSPGFWKKEAFPSRTFGAQNRWSICWTNMLTWNSLLRDIQRLLWRRY